MRTSETTIIDRMNFRDPASAVRREITGGDAHTADAVDRLLEDVSDLLNAEVRFLRPKANYKHLEGALLNCGMPDVSHRYLSGEKAPRSIGEEVTRALSRFEPRLARLKTSAMAREAATSPGAVFLRVTAESRLATPLPDGAFVTVVNAANRPVKVRVAP